MDLELNVICSQINNIKAQNRTEQKSSNVLSTFPTIEQLQIVIIEKIHKSLRAATERTELPTEYNLPHKYMVFSPLFATFCVPADTDA